MQGINRMEESFGYPGTARVMIDDVTMTQAGAYQRQLSEIEGVDSVSWLPGGNAYLPEILPHRGGHLRLLQGQQRHHGCDLHLWGFGPPHL
ncbi:MAG: hypothetical protein V8Q30_00180 [Acutalibacteraceae bacterium]